MSVLVGDIIDEVAGLAEVFPPAVTITRTSNDDFGSRQLVASIDGRHVATLLWGDSVTCPLNPGRHRLRVHNTLFWKTIDFTLGVNEQLFFEAVNHVGPATYLLLTAIGVGPLYVTVKRMF
jgi:hypothetical protein